MKLTDKEKIILGERLDNYRFIHRDSTSNLWITKDRWLVAKPLRESDDIYWFGMYRHLFNKIKDGEEYEIAELLKGE